MLAVINKDIKKSTYELNRLERIVEERRRKLHEAMEDVSALRRKLHGLHSLMELQCHKELETSCHDKPSIPTANMPRQSQQLQQETAKVMGLSEV